MVELQSYSLRWDTMCNSSRMREVLQSVPFTQLDSLWWLGYHICSSSRMSSQDDRGIAICDTDRFLLMAKILSAAPPGWQRYSQGSIADGITWKTAQIHYFCYHPHIQSYVQLIYYIITSNILHFALELLTLLILFTNLWTLGFNTLI